MSAAATASDHVFTRSLNTLISRQHGPAISHRKLAELIRQTTGSTISGAYVWQLRSGQATNPGFETLDQLRRHFGLDSTDPLFGLDGQNTDSAVLAALRHPVDDAELDTLLSRAIGGGRVGLEALRGFVMVASRQCRPNSTGR